MHPIVTGTGTRYIYWSTFGWLNLLDMCPCPSFHDGPNNDEEKQDNNNTTLAEDNTKEPRQPTKPGGYT